MKIELKNLVQLIASYKTRSLKANHLRGMQ